VDAAMSRHSWAEAAALLEGLDRPPSADDLARLASCAWWLGEIDRCIELRERAFRAFLDDDRPADAAEVAILLVEDHFHKLQDATGRSWLKRAEQLLVDRPDSRQAGWLARFHGMAALDGQADLEVATRHIDLAVDIAGRSGDRDLLALALHDHGRALIMAGRVEEGLALMEEVMAAAVGGDLAPLVAGKVYCNMIDVSERLADYQRAGQWDDAARRWCERAGNQSGFPGVCRVKRASIMRLRGRWSDAMHEAERGTKELSHFLDLAARGFVEMGTIRLLTGDLAGAELAFTDAIQAGCDPQPGLALLRVAQGRPDLGHALLGRAFESPQRSALDVTRLAVARAEVAVLVGDLEAAGQAAEVLASTTTGFDTDALAASRSYASAVVAQATGRLEEAEGLLRAAALGFRDADLPYEAARARLRLAEVYRSGGQPELAKPEAEAAAAAFDQLGASPAAREARDALADLDTVAEAAVAAWMFTDIAGSTRLVEAMGDQAWSNVVRWHDDTVRACVVAHGGRELDRAGDGFFVSFPDAERAITCAAEIQRRLARHRHEEGYPVHVRIGIHVGEAVRVGTSYTGREIHLAARIMSSAAADQVMVSERALDGSGHRAVEAGLADTKGLDEPVRTFEILWSA
jgi:class 3 adenylate cyclase